MVLPFGAPLSSHRIRRGCLLHSKMQKQLWQRSMGLGCSRASDQRNYDVTDSYLAGCAKNRWRCDGCSLPHVRKHFRPVRFDAPANGASAKARSIIDLCEPWWVENARVFADLSVPSYVVAGKKLQRCLLFAVRNRVGSSICFFAAGNTLLELSKSCSRISRSDTICHRWLQRGS